jgi:hypothetical protein
MIRNHFYLTSNIVGGRISIIMKPRAFSKSVILAVILLTLVVVTETVEWILLLRGQEIRWFTIFSSTVSLLLTSVLVIYLVVVLWRER